MKIYTEVNYIWKDDKLVQTSSESFDYFGEVSKCDTRKGGPRWARFNIPHSHWVAPTVAEVKETVMTKTTEAKEKLHKETTSAKASLAKETTKAKESFMQSASYIKDQLPETPTITIGGDLGTLLTAFKTGLAEATSAGKVNLETAADAGKAEWTNIMDAGKEEWTRWMDAGQAWKGDDDETTTTTTSPLLEGGDQLGDPYGRGGLGIASGETGSLRRGVELKKKLAPSLINQKIQRQLA